MSKVSFDNPALKNIRKALKAIDGKKLESGWFPSANYDKGKPVAGIAAIQEYGTASIPPRSFFRMTVDEKSKSWASLVESGAKSMLEGKATAEQVMSAIGLRVVGDVQDTIGSGGFQALSPITLALRKLRRDNVPIGGKMVGAVAAAIAEGKTGSGELGEPSANTTPLNDRGIMIATMTYEVS